MRCLRVEVVFIYVIFALVRLFMFMLARTRGDRDRGFGRRRWVSLRVHRYILDGRLLLRRRVVGVGLSHGISLVASGDACPGEHEAMHVPPGRSNLKPQ
jgi:hypothetical protein